MQYYKAICINENTNNSDKSIEILLGIIDCYDVEDIFTYLSRSLRGETEINICNAVAVNESKRGNKLLALKIFLEINKNLSKYDFIHSKYMVKNLYNIVKVSYALERYEDVIFYADKNIELCQKGKIVSLYADTYMYKANAEKKTGQNDKYIRHYKKFIYLAHFFDDQDRMKTAIDKVCEHNDLILDVEVL